MEADGELKRKYPDWVSDPRLRTRRSASLPNDPVGPSFTLALWWLVAGGPPARLMITGGTPVSHCDLADHHGRTTEHNDAAVHRRVTQSGRHQVTDQDCG